MLPLILRLGGELLLGELVNAAMASGSKTKVFSGGGGVKSKLVWSSDTLTPRMAASLGKADAYMRQVTELYTLRSEAYARQNAPWTDRTGNARSGLTGQGTIEGSARGARYEINLFHRAPYGIWLETRHDGRFSIINKTINAEAPQFFKTASGMFSRMFG